MTLAEYTRPNRVGYANQAANNNAPVKVKNYLEEKIFRFCNKKIFKGFFC